MHAITRLWHGTEIGKENANPSRAMILAVWPILMQLVAVYEEGLRASPGRQPMHDKPRHARTRNRAAPPGSIPSRSIEGLHRQQLWGFFC